MRNLLPLLGCTLLFGFVVSESTEADIIDHNSIVAITSGTVGSGNGTIDLRMMTFSGSEIENEVGSFNGDNGNNTLPQGGGADTGSFSESYVTTAAELQAFYILNFPDGNGGSFVDELGIFIDLDETGGAASATNWMDKLDIVVNPATIQGSPNPGLDVTSAQQASIDQTFTGGTLMANMISNANLPVLAQGAGFADYAIHTGINPFALNPNDVVLFNVSMSSLNNGAEEIFLSGEFSFADVVIPEPTALVPLLIGVAALVPRRRKESLQY